MAKRCRYKVGVLVGARRLPMPPPEGTCTRDDSAPPNNVKSNQGSKPTTTYYKTDYYHAQQHNSRMPIHAVNKCAIHCMHRLIRVVDSGTLNCGSRKTRIATAVKKKSKLPCKANGDRDQRVATVGLCVPVTLTRSITTKDDQAFAARHTITEIQQAAVIPVRDTQHRR